MFEGIFIIKIYTNYLKSTKNKPLCSHSGKGGDPGTHANAGGSAEVWGVGVQINGEGAQKHRGGAMAQMQGPGAQTHHAAARGADGRGTHGGAGAGDRDGDALAGAGCRTSRSRV